MPADDASSPGSLEPGPSSDRDIEVRELLELEKARIDWNNHQVALNERTFALEEARDQREFQFATATRATPMSPCGESGSRFFGA